MASREGEQPLLRPPMLYNPARAESASKPLEAVKKVRWVSIHASPVSEDRSSSGHAAFAVSA